MKNEEAVEAVAGHRQPVLPAGLGQRGDPVQMPAAGTSMEFRDYMTALATKIRQVSTDRDELDILKWVTETTAELHGVSRWLHAQLTGNLLVALNVYTYDSAAAYQTFQDSLTDAHVEARAREIAPLLDAMSDMSDADES